MARSKQIKKNSKSKAAKKAGKVRPKKAPPPAPVAAPVKNVHSYTPDPHALQALTEAIPAICEFMGVPEDRLILRDAGQNPREVAVLAVRKLALGAVAALGNKSLGLRWAALYGEGAPDSLLGVQRSTLSIFAQEFLAWTGLDGYHEGKPTGDISSTARIRFAEVEAAALKRVAVLRARAAVAA